jgi:signal transduction histidine kinase
VSKPDGSAAPFVVPLLTLELRYERDVVLARQRARQLCAHLGLDAQEQTRIATAVSELARNAYQYAGGGRVAFSVEGAPGASQLFVVAISDSGPGIGNLADVLEGRYVSATGMGLGIVGARRLSDRFRIESAPSRGTRVEIARALPLHGRVFRLADAGRVADLLLRTPASNEFEEVQEQNRELLTALSSLRARQAEVERLNAELEATNRGVVALYAELDQRAEELRRASEYKSRFLSDISHELRTPLTSVLNVSRLLLDRSDGELTEEQEYQVTLIRRSIEMVTDMVNELLDTAKIEAGMISLRPARFTVAQLFDSLREMATPLLTSDSVVLRFDAAPSDAALVTDEGRLSQILRNLVSNAIKFTERGEIRVSAERVAGDCVRFAVGDTGIGIAPNDVGRIFDDYTQIDGPIQRRVRGTGLGLPLTRKLAALLGGRIEVESEPGVGSTFAVVIPARLAESGDASPSAAGFASETHVG